MPTVSDGNVFDLLRRLEAGQEDIRNTLKEIQDALFGDPKYGRQGLVAQIKDQEERIRSLERRQLGGWQVVVALLTVIAAAAIVDMRAYIHMDDLEAAGVAFLVTAIGIFGMVFWMVRSSK